MLFLFDNVDPLFVKNYMKVILFSKLSRKGNKSQDML